ncbi:helix-turn-helix domain-containing protein [Flagellimonas marinaquae]|uniref:helix-turn-helix domain-containing protein n=1 Tax=Flagellimonas aurea TaxID=2915619 RepID=UPI001CE21623|nr:helix-turn-helix domain-containing protein [Allomuricauda aquimarina]
MEGLVTANEAAEILECTRQHIDYLVKKKKLMPISTIYPRLYFDKDEVLLLKEMK